MKPCQFLFSLLLGCTLFAAAQTAAPKANGKRITISPLSFVAESDGLLSIDSVRHLFTAGQAQTISTFHPNFGRSRHRHWLSFSIHSRHTQTVVLETNNPFFYHIELYNDSSLLYSSGINFPFAHRPIHHRQFAFPITVHKGKNVFYLMADRRGEVLRFSMHIVTPSAFQKRTSSDAYFFGALLGIVALVAIFSFFLLLVLRDRLHFYYLLYAILVWIFVVADNGLGYQWLWPHAPLVQKYIRSFTSYPAFLLQLQIASLFLQSAERSRFAPWLHRLFWTGWLPMLALLAYVIADVAGASLVGSPTDAMQALFYIFYALGAGVLLINLAEGWRAQNRWAKIYTIAILPLLIHLGLLIATRQQLINVDLDTAKLLSVALLVELIGLGYGLILQYAVLQQKSKQLVLQLGQQQQALMQSILDAQDAERKRIAEDLHDQLGGTLSAVKSMIAFPADAQRTYQAQTALEEACKDLRFIAHGLMPASFQQGHLSSAISESVEKANHIGATRFSFINTGTEVVLEPATELTLFRMVNELINNVIKHAGATEATVQLFYYSDFLQLLVEDNGKGFRISEVHSGIGMKNLYSRARYLNAELCYDSGPQGTTVICTFPFTTA